MFGTNVSHKCVRSSFQLKRFAKCVTCLLLSWIMGGEMCNIFAECVICLWLSLTTELCWEYMFIIPDNFYSSGMYLKSAIMCKLNAFSRSYYESVIIWYVVFFIVVKSRFSSIKCVKRYLRKLKTIVKCVKWVSLLSIMEEKKYVKKLMFSYFYFFMKFCFAHW